jgi:hypothetical protein
MPSTDSFHSKRPELNRSLVNDGLVSSDPERLRETSARAPGATGSRAGQRAMSAQVQRLAKRLDKDPDELAKKIPADTLRRTKYPVIEQVDEQGRRTFKHDTGIEDDGRIALVKR